MDTAGHVSKGLQRRLRIGGIVQGVGFRPYVWRLAQTLHLTGWVCNDAAGVEVLVEGGPADIETFTQRLPAEIPPLAEVRDLTWRDACASGKFTAFTITASRGGKASTMIGHDTAVCADCLAELFDPADRRYRYAFINCTHCGPRYTLTRRLPYDRAQTSMAAFPFCPDCEREYRNPADRRFHAEPTACRICGPKLQFVPLGDGASTASEPIAATLACLHAGEIVAIKGLGGFHLACNAYDSAAVQRLRLRKNREEKPLAIMVANPDSVTAWVEMSAAERALLESPERPIVLLRKRPGVDARFPDLAPGLSWLGVMLPYTPIHWLLFHSAAGLPAGTAWMGTPQALALVMTSANPGGEPLVIDNDEAVARLADIAYAALLHDRDIVVRCDDSVVRVGCNDHAPAADCRLPTADYSFIRRARGYTPGAIHLSHAGPPVLALGGWLKNTICVMRGDQAYVSQHIGGLDNAATCGMLVEVTLHLLDILQVRPEAVAHDLHPDFFSTRHALQLAAEWGVPAIAVQHHHAHIAAVMAEHGVDRPVLGLALDGVGLGSDGSAWGGELLRVEGADFTRLGHLTPLPLPGGDRAAREPWRMAAAALWAMGRGDEIAQRFATQPLAQPLAQRLMQAPADATSIPTTTSLGRCFDAAAGLLGVRTTMAYEGQAAMLLEGLAETHGEIEALPQGYHIAAGQLDLLPLLARLADEPDIAYGAALFHATLAEALANWTLQYADSIDQVAMGGGCFLNHILARRLRTLLTAQGLHVLEARRVPPNDGGLSLGQAQVVRKTLEKP